MLRNSLKPSRNLPNSFQELSSSFGNVSSLSGDEIPSLETPSVDLSTITVDLQRNHRTVIRTIHPVVDQTRSTGRPDHAAVDLSICGGRPENWVPKCISLIVNNGRPVTLQWSTGPLFWPILRWKSLPFDLWPSMQWVTLIWYDPLIRILLLILKWTQWFLNNG